MISGDRATPGRYVFRDFSQTMQDTERFLKNGQAHVETPLDGTIGGLRHARDSTTPLVTAGGLPVAFGRPDAPSLRLLSGQSAAEQSTSLTNLNTAAGYQLSPAFGHSA